jgi:hypothetical protein
MADSQLQFSPWAPTLPTSLINVNLTARSRGVAIMAANYATRLHC